MVKRASWLELKGSYEAIGGARFPPHPFHGIAGWLPVVSLFPPFGLLVCWMICIPMIISLSPETFNLRTFRSCLLDSPCAQFSLPFCSFVFTQTLGN